ncbi:glycine C-acetyltransferase [Candidatus Laterigemmans baculatus]|uniref:glycine C-acetyltransferase n=1 Tax=Candidatus Laterigemmans baculatus TaxID=2770505 RepID=UPI0013D91E17|nr:glycine C-acetyltransferase [Candidatus Laterigemmans baculatus]
MNDTYLRFLRDQLDDLQTRGLYKAERPISTPQQARIETSGRRVINLCANNYLGLADHPALVEAAKQALDRYGYGMASVRFICGTQTVHKQLEEKLAEFLGTEDAILYSSCFDANTGLFETLLGPEDAILSDELNHASIIDGVRLCKAKRFRYRNNNLADLEQQLEEARDRRFRLICTDGVFSMDGIVANLEGIGELAKRYDAMLMVDDSHAVGFLGDHGRGTPEFCGVRDQVDILTGTLGKALGGASGGYTAGRKEVIEWLRQRSRPYLFSNTLAPVIAATSLKVLEMLQASGELRQRLQDNSQFFRSEMTRLGFELVPGSHPIIPVMTGDARLAQKMSEELLREGVYVIGFAFPVVPENKARIRTQMSAAHSRDDLEQAVAAFAKVGRALGLMS